MNALSEVKFRLLSLVYARELAGRESAAEYRKEFGKKISYGTLYTTFRRLENDGFVESREDVTDDRRVRYFRITPNGKMAFEGALGVHSELANLGNKVVYGA